MECLACLECEDEMIKEDCEEAIQVILFNRSNKRVEEKIVALFEDRDGNVLSSEDVENMEDWEIDERSIHLLK
jgi:hypothetical protein